MTWTPASSATGYSVAFSKSKFADPGPLADVFTSSYSKTDVKPGRWYLNVKAGNSCGWGQVYTWDVDVPYTTPSLSLLEEVTTENERKILYSSNCATSIKISPTLGMVKAPAGTVVIHPKKTVTYTAIAKYGDQQTFRSVSIEYPLPSPSPKPIATPLAEDSKVILPQLDNSINNYWEYVKAVGFVTAGALWARLFINSRKQ